MTLLTQSEISIWWPVSVNLDASRYDPYQLRAEQNSLQSILGPELYHALKSAPLVSGDRFDKLLNGDLYKDGSNYEREYPGVKPLLAAYTYAYLVDNNALHLTRGGVQRKVAAETSENLSAREVSTASQAAYSEAIRLEGQFYDFMAQRSGDYPEYELGGRPSKNSSLNFFNASTCGRYGF